MLFNLFFYCSLLFLFSFTKSLIPTAGLYFFLNTGIVVVAIKNHQSVFHRFTCNHQSQHLHQTNHLFPLFSFLFITSSSFLSFLYFVFSSSSPLFLFAGYLPKIPLSKAFAYAHNTPPFFLSSSIFFSFFLSFFCLLVSAFLLPYSPKSLLTL